MAPDLITLDAEGEAGRIIVGNDVIPSPGAAFVSLPKLPAMQEEQLTLQPALPGMLNTLCITPLGISFQVLEFPALLSPSCFQSHFQRLKHAQRVSSQVSLSGRTTSLRGGKGSKEGSIPQGFNSVLRGGKAAAGP